MTGDEITFVVLDRVWRLVEPAERFLESLRQEQYSPHTVRSYAGGLALWWSLLESRDQDWRHVGVDDLVRFVRRLRNRGTRLVRVYGAFCCVLPSRPVRVRVVYRSLSPARLASVRCVAAQSRIAATNSSGASDST